MRLLVANAMNDRSEVAIYQRLQARGNTLLVTCDEREPQREALLQAGIRLTPLPCRNRLDFTAVRRLRALIRDFRPDVILASRNATLSVSLMARGRTPIAVVGYRGTVGHISRLDPAAWLTYLHPALDGIWCVSGAVQHYLQGFGIPSTKMATIYKGHELAWYQDVEPVPRPALNIPEGAILVGFTGSIRPVKGVDGLLRALATLRHEIPNLHLLLVGDVQQKTIAPLIKQLGISDRVHRLGYRSDAINCTKACDLFVMPSLEREGLPRAVIEAMAMGIPVITSRAGGLPELVRDGIDGLTGPPGDVAALAAAIARLASDFNLRQQLGQAGQRRIGDSFTITTTVEGLSDLLQRAIAHRTETRKS